MLYAINCANTNVMPNTMRDRANQKQTDKK